LREKLSYDAAAKRDEKIGFLEEFEVVCRFLQEGKLLRV
jgi:hypothetical protein